MWNLRNLVARPIVLKLTAFLLQDNIMRPLADKLSSFVDDSLLQLAGSDSLGTSALSDTTSFSATGTDSLGTSAITDSVAAG